MIGSSTWPAQRLPELLNELGRRAGLEPGPPEQWRLPLQHSVGREELERTTTELRQSYTVRRADEQLAVFVNPDHDFPKRIEYRLEGGRLVAAIAGDEPGPSWTFERIGTID